MDVGLVLERKIGERICVVTPSGDEIWITMTGFNGRKIKIGVRAPRVFTIDREEIYHARKRCERVLGKE